jgi:hypothetical protein
MKKILLASLIFMTSIAHGELAVVNNTPTIQPTSTYAVAYRNQTGNYHVLEVDKDGNPGVDKEVEAAFTDKFLRNISNDTLQKFIEEGGYIQIRKMSDGEYVLHAQMRGVGGGFWGAVAGFWTGKVAVHIGSQLLILGTSAVVGLICPPIAPAVYAGLTSATAIPVEIASNHVGLATGIAGAVITGPV